MYLTLRYLYSAKPSQPYQTNLQSHPKLLTHNSINPTNSRIPHKPATSRNNGRVSHELPIQSSFPSPLPPRMETQSAHFLLFSPKQRKSRPSSQLTALLLLPHSWINRENRVPHYQRLFQKNDGVRYWNKVRFCLRVLRFASWLSTWRQKEKKK